MQMCGLRLKKKFKTRNIDSPYLGALLCDRPREVGVTDRLFRKL